jgi:hypothetical protein
MVMILLELLPLPNLFDAFLLLDMAMVMSREARRHEEDMEHINKQLTHVQTELAAAVRDKTEVDSKLVELDELVAQLLNLNEALVAKLSGKPYKKSALLSAHLLDGHAAKSAVTKKTKTKKAGGLVPRAATATTAAAEAGKVQKYDLVKHLQAVHIDPADIDHLTMMHNMYRGLAKTLQSKLKPGTGGKVSKAAAGAGADSSGLTGRKPTRMSRKKQQKSQQQLETRTGNGSVHMSRTMDDSDIDYDSMNRTSTSARKSVSVSPSTRGRVLHNTSLNASSFGSNNSSLLGASNISHSGLKQVITSLENEFDSLNAKYRTLIHDTGPKRDGGSVSAGDSAESSAESASEELINVIQQIHRKEDQLRSLRNTMATSHAGASSSLH